MQEYPSEIHTKEKPVSFEKERKRFLNSSRVELNECPRTSYGAERSPLHKSRRSSYLEMKRLTRLERSAASPAVTHPLHTHTRTQGYALTHSQGGATSLEREVLCQLVPVMDNCISIFTQRHFRKNAKEEGESLSVVRCVGLTRRWRRGRLGLLG